MLKNGSTLRADSDSMEPASARLASRRGKRYGLVRQPVAYALEALQGLRGTPLASTADAAHNGRVGVETDIRALAHAPAPTTLGVSTGCMVKGFVVSAPAGLGVYRDPDVLVQAVRAQKLQARAVGCPVTGSRAAQDDAGVGKPRWSVSPVWTDSRDGRAWLRRREQLGGAAAL